MKLLLLFSALAALGALSFAQSDLASLSGLITDPGGGVIAGAVVKLKSIATSYERIATSSPEGRYDFERLPSGTYMLNVETPGFKRFSDTEVRLQVAQAATLDARLEVGSAAESVVVSADVSPLTTQTAAQGTVITQEKITALPLNGRQFIQMALLLPGASVGGRNVQQDRIRQNQMGGLSIAGNRTNNTAFLLDGVANTDPDYHALNYSPVVDAIAEFQVQTSAISAEYGRASGGQINVVTKSGTNTLHGSAWDFLRNKIFDARPFNLNSSDLPQYQRNQFGATLGGPILRNRVFGFFAWESLRLRQVASNLTTVAVPTSLERQGKFSQSTVQIFDPNTLQNNVRQPFPNNAIPVNRIGPIALYALQTLPLPNVPGTSLFVNSGEKTQQNGDNYSGRVDAVLTRQITLFGRYSLGNESGSVPYTIPNRPNIFDARPQNGAVGLTTILRSNLINEARLGYQRLRFLNGLAEPEFTINGQRTRIPRFRVAGLPFFGGAGPFDATGQGGVALVRDNTYQAYDNTSWILGRQSFKFGGEIYITDYNRQEVSSPLGLYQFVGGYTARTRTDNTGSAVASFLLALSNNVQRTLGPNSIARRQNTYSLYVQDDIRIRPTITINVGLRYELAPPMYDRHHDLSSLDFSRVPSPQAIFASGILNSYNPTLFVCGRDGYPSGCAYTDKTNFSPRLGVAWSVNPKTVVRLGAGLYYGVQDANTILRLAAGLPKNLAQTFTADNFIPSFKGFNVFGPATVGDTRVQASALDLHQNTPYSAQLSFNIQREFRRNVIEAGYLATFGVHLEQNVQINNAQPGLGSPDPRRPYNSALFAPSVKFPPEFKVLSDRVPIGFVNFYPHWAHSSYHALVVRFERRFARGFSLLSSFTYSKAITNAPQFRNAGGLDGNENSPPQDSFHINTERGLAYFHQKFRWVTSYVYELPFGPGKRWANSGIASAILGGFEFSHILTLQTGFPFTVNVSGDPAGIGGGTGGILIRPNVLVDSSGRPRDPNLPPDRRSTARWFDTSALALAPPASFGNLGRNNIIGPGLFNSDITLSRTFRKREFLKLELRGEAFNVLNTPNYNLVGRVVNDPTYGQVTSQLDPRQIQFAARFTF